MTQANNSGRDQRITDMAHKIWEEEGRPEGQAEAHWARAMAIVDAEALVKKPVAKKATAKAKAAPKKK
jgi:hypothetical protein